MAIAGTTIRQRSRASVRFAMSGGIMKIRYWLLVVASSVLVACATSPATHQGTPTRSTPAAAPTVNARPQQAQTTTHAAPPAEVVPSPSAPMPVAPLPPATVPAAPPVVAKPVHKAPPPPASVEKTAEKPVPAAASNTTGTVFGHVDVSGSSSAAEIAQTVVYFVPDVGAPSPKPGEYRVYTHRRAFDPPSMAIPLGSRIVFPNQDDILHNVFSATPGSEFDLGSYAVDERASYAFRKAGIVTVNCNVHQEMQANILVLATPYFANADANGDFRIANLPAGPGTFSMWHPRAQTQTRALVVPSLEPLALQLVLTKPAVSAHLNKERRQYQPRVQP
jgi:hypothetical protein